MTLPSKTIDPDARFSRGARHLFLVPWRGVTLVGVWHKVFASHPDTYEIEDAELSSWIEEIDLAYPELGLTLDDVALGSAGLVPFGENDGDAANLKFAHRSRIVDHARSDGVQGLLSLIGVRYTTGPFEAAKLVGQIVAGLGNGNTKSRLAWSPVKGGDIDDFSALVEQIRQAGVEPDAAEALAHNHGTAWQDIIQRGRSPKRLPETTVHEEEIVHAVRHEMAQTLADIVFRRTDLLTTGVISKPALRRTLEVASAEAGWGEERARAEMRFVLDRLDIARTGRTMLADQLPDREPIAV